jgi:hypothetical protein
MNKDKKNVDRRLANLEKKMNPVDIAGIGVSDPYPKIDHDKIDELLEWVGKNLKNDINIYNVYLEKLETFTGAELRVFNKSLFDNPPKINWEL